MTPVAVNAGVEERITFYEGGFKRRPTLTRTCCPHPLHQVQDATTSSVGHGLWRGGQAHEPERDGPAGRLRRGPEAPAGH